MQVVSLWEYFCEKTQDDANSFYSRTTSSPPVALIVSSVVATIFFIALNSQVYFVFGALAVAQIIWFVLVKSTSNSHNLADALRQIESGKFPPEMKETITKRLRWWNFLIVPQEWTHNSKLYELQDRFKTRIEFLLKKREYWNSSEGLQIRSDMEKEAHEANERREEQKKKLKLLQSRGVNVTALDDEPEAKGNSLSSESYSDPEALSRLIKTNILRDEQMRRISRITDPLSKINEELVFTQAMLIKSEKITTLLDKIENLNPPIQKVSAGNIDAAVHEIISVLEQRRKYVAQLNQIPPKRVLTLLNYDICFTDRDHNNNE